MKRVVLGKIGKVHGIKGWLRLASFTAPPENILDYPNLQVDIGQVSQTLVLDEYRQQSKGLVVHFEGFDDPETASALTGREVWVENSALPALEPGDYYWQQLQGLRVENQQGELLGTVSRMLETGANDVMVVAPGADSIDDRERLIPYIKESVVKAIDLKLGRILVDWEASYLE